MHDDLGDHAVIVGRDELAGRGDGDDVHVLCNGKARFFDGARMGTERQRPFAVRLHPFGVDARFNGVALELRLKLGNGLAGGDAELLANDVDAGHPFGDRMLHLQTGVHLHEVHRPCGEVEDELHGARPDVAHLIRNGPGVGQHVTAQILRQHGGTGLLEHLLLVPLHAAIPQAQHQGVAQGVAQQLHLNVPQRRDALLQIDVAVAEGALRLGGDPMEELKELRAALHHLNALAAASVNGLDEHRIADFVGHLGGPFGVGQNAVAARNHWHPQTQRGVDGVGLVAHGLHAGDGRPDEVQAAAAGQFRELGAFGQEADARMQRVRPLLLGDAEHAAGVQVALVRGVAADADQRVPLTELVGHCRFHVRVRLHQNHFQAMALGHPHQLRRSAAAGVDQQPLDGPNEVGVGVAGRGHNFRGFPVEHPGEHAPNHGVNRLLRQRNVRVDPAQVVVELDEEGVFHQALHGLRVG